MSRGAGQIGKNVMFFVLNCFQYKDEFRNKNNNADFFCVIY